MGLASKTERREAICQAVFELLSEVGYDRMSMDAVAARARASKATIYRAWPNKPDLVKDAILHRFGAAPPPPDTGSLRGDLFASLTMACAVANGRDGAVFTGLMTAATHDPELCQTMHWCTYEAKHATYETIVSRAIERGELAGATHAGLLHEVVHALVLAKCLWQAGPLDEAYVTRIVDRVLLPILLQDT